MSSRRVSFSPDVNDLFTKHHGCGMKVGGNKKRVVITGFWAYRPPTTSRLPFSHVGFLKRLGAKMAKALRFVSKNRKSSRKVSSSSSTLARSRSYAETLDSHRAEAIEDCIEFLNSSSSSSSLQRSNSVTTVSY